MSTQVFDEAMSEMLYLGTLLPAKGLLLGPRGRKGDGNDPLVLPTWAPLQASSGLGRRARTVESQCNRVGPTYWPILS
jgi:hypothetical protein